MRRKSYDVYNGRAENPAENKNTEVHTMKTAIFLCTDKKPQRITRKKAIELVGEERFKKMLAEAKEVFREDPFTNNSFWIGGNRILNFEFFA